MDKLWTLPLSIILLSLTQIQYVFTTGCDITSVTSPRASSLNVVWNGFSGASSYILDLRVVNSTSIAPVVLTLTASRTQREVRGLRPGRVYQVTLKALQFFSLQCTDTKIAMTVPATSQITLARAISSTSITFQWSSVTGADQYILFVQDFFNSAQMVNQSFTTLTGQVDGLTPSTTYNCFVYSSNSAGRGAKSRSRTITTLVQPPTGVTVVSTGKSTARVTWNSVAKVLMYQVTVSDNGNPSASPVIKDTSTTTMDIENLEPCSTYTVGVSSVNGFLVAGEPSDVLYNTSTIHPVTTVSANYSCSSSMVTVTWDLVFGANSYRASAIDGTGEALNCTSSSTSCRITMLKCGERYQVEVTAISDDCESTSNTSTVFETVPCAPANLTAHRECSSSVIVLTWQPTNNTRFYVAKAVDNTGGTVECRTADNTCFFTNTGCGQAYIYTVYAVSTECNSEVSPSQYVRTSPCSPTNVRTSADCQSEVLITTWDTAAGALSYFVEALGNNGETYNCSSHTSSCAVAGVPCGEHLSVWIVASDDHCSSSKVLGEVAETVPCTPTNVSAIVSCSQDSARVNWTRSNGAVFYTAVAEHQNGMVRSCSSMSTNCLIEGLNCGQTYTATVFAANMKCNSTPSEEVTIVTAPCAPSNVEAFRDCAANHALIMWQRDQLTGSYTATIEDQSGEQLNCTTNTYNNCKIPSLPCGMTYNVTVTYDDGNCPATSAPISLDSVPCGPQDVQASVACDTGELTVAWNISMPAENYTAIISSGTGQRIHCNSTETQCTLGGLECGSSYMVTVFSVTGACYSLPSADITIQTVPCAPTNVTAARTCGLSSVDVTWVASLSAINYTAVAVDQQGQRLECSTSETSCSLDGLQCGEVYTIGVASVDDRCTSQQSQTVSLYTVPCSPANLSSQVNCTAGTAQLSWSPSPNAETYAVKATGAVGEIMSCNSSNPGCLLSDLDCGQDYNITVSASDGTCTSPYSAPIRLETVPCAPLNMTTNLLCDANILMVSWIPAAMPLNYSATAMPLAGNIRPVSCHTEQANCSLRGLQCGQMYNVSVRASYGSCAGPYSTAQTVQTAPCPPQSLAGMIDCGSRSLLASWNASLGATHYTTTVTGPGGFSETSSSSNLMSSFTGLQCASQYNITVTSHDSHCSSSPSRTTAMTEPCDPVNVMGVLLCGSDMATVSWDASAGAVAYTAFAQENGSQHSTSCRSSTTSCQLSQLNCGTIYNLTVLAEDETCNSTGNTSTMLMTAPCPPSIQNSTLICGTNSTSLLWTPVADATGYIANATAASGHTVSCSSATTTCELADLLCGETYTASVTARGSQCDSAPSSSVNITTAPCSPTITFKQYDCGNNTAVFGWTDPMGRVSFEAQLEAGGQVYSCQTTNTSCAFHSLPCGLNYTMTVQAQGALCSSPPSTSESMETVPCAPQNVSASLVCLNHSALVTWVGSPSAIAYNVTMVGQDGHTHLCYTNSTSCQIPNLHCGETYSITVIPYSETCAGNPSAVYSFSTGLCPPRNVSVSPMCEGSTVSWTNVTGADMYVATATANDGHTHSCSSNHSSSCSFNDLHCGETYDVTVVTVDRGCYSEPSSAVQLRAALCPPTNLTGHVSCETNALTLTWDPSPEAGANYILKAERIGSSLHPLMYRTSDTSRVLTGLMCGQKYTFQVAASDGTCTSSYSPPLETGTAPCPPTNFTGRVDCGTNKGHFSWDDSDGADFYTVEVTGDHGHVASCSSNDSSCAVKLHCGRSYSATLVASTDSCNSSQHADIHFDSAPCLPEDVVAELECSTNMMTVSWQETPGSDDYTAMAISQDGHRVSCNSSSNNCSIYGLECGQTYEVAVTSSSIHCDIIAGSDYQVQSAPCKPENTTVDLNCSTNGVTISWDHAGTAQNYTVMATAALGVNSTCSSTETSCSFLDLSCGELYTFTVMGHTNVCMSEMSTPMEKLTAPCPPTNVLADLNCRTGEALVTWSIAPGASAYSVQAESRDGHNSSCSDTGTSCVLHDLVCGQEYTVDVVSMHTGCPGPASVPAMLITEPCVPMNVSVLYNVGVAQVLWDAARGASSYSVEAVTDQGFTVTCNTTDTYCSLTGMQCSQMYNITVTAHNLACNDTVMSETHYLMTEPCPPTNVQASVMCELLTATVSWEQSDHAVGYVAYFDGQSGHDTSCAASNADSSCSVSGLMCGTTYSIRVKALGQQYNSSDSTAISLASGPCQPSDIEAIVDCQADSATISWLPAIGAVSYVTELTASSGHIAYCATNYTNCQFSSLRCGEEYNVTVKALGETCNNTAQMAGSLITEPCVPMNVSVLYNVGVAQVLWDAARGASSYSVEAVTDQGLTITCNTTNTYCSLTGMQCSQMYNITVTAHNLACNDTVMSETHCLMTEPCPPTNIEANLRCELLAATVSWEESDYAVGYVAYFDGQNGHDTSCSASNPDTYCRASGLMCGTVYSIKVKALGRQYNSSDSMAVNLTSAPCLPDALHVEVDCNSDGAAVVSWNMTEGTSDFSLTAVVSGSYQTLCTTQQSSCNVSGLSCGQSYDVSLSASNAQCNVTAPVNTNLTTRPCAPQRLAVDLTCGSQTAVLSWEEKSEVELYIASATRESGGEVQLCNSTGSTCSFPALACGETYNFTVTAHSQGCSSQASSTVSITTEPCQPVIVSAQAPCQSEVVQISWHPAGGVVKYMVTATGSLGYVEIYNTTDTLLSAPLPCGQDYSITVQGQGSECDSMPSSPAYTKTTPCIPQDLVTYVQCEYNIGSVNWAPSDGAETYTAVATGLDGHTHQCDTNTTSCTWEDLHCGEEYTVVVRAKDENCTSLPSNSSVIHMDPCVPQNLVGTVDCGMNVVSLSWHASEGANTYMVAAAAGDNMTRLTTNDTEAYFSELSCGQVYSLTVTPHNQHCAGNSSASAQIETWPCPPTAVSAYQDCLSNIVMVTWQASNGTDYYTANMETDDGLSNTCMSPTNECSVPGLACGRNVSVSVTASNHQCNSTSAVPAELQTVPCVPTGVSVVVDCPNNTAVVSWSASQGAVEYSVTAQSSQGNITCQGSELSCSLTNLTCGISYTVQVVAVGDSCSSTPSQAQMFNSPPCPPQGVRAEINCQSKALTVSWLPNADVDFFLVSRMEEMGDYASWNSSNTPFLMNMDCGKTFSVQVTAIKDGCHSQPSDPVSTSIMPCVPTGVSVVVDCPNNTAVVSWSASQGAVQYSVTALSSQDSIICQGSELSCILTNLTCGISYTVQVVAEGDSCSSTPSQVQRFNSPPCPPQDVRAEIDCLSEALAVSWLPNADVDFFLVSRMVEIGDYASWNTSNTSFSMNMDCGKTFSVQVTAIKDGCHSQPSDPVSTSSAPCQPQAVRGSLDCVTNSAWISWDAAAGAENYTVTAVGGEDYEANCTTSTNTTCEVQDLACGVLYNFSVTASNIRCVGPPSTTIDLQTAPCSLSSITAFAQCHNSSILVTWDLMEGGEGDIVYIATAEASDHTYLSCNSTGTSCYLEGARCDLHYTIIVAASSDQCSSLRSPPYRISMEPCPPSNVMVNVSCEDHEAMVSWTPSPVAETYDVFAMCRDGHVHNCTTSSSNCSLSDLHCGEHYTVFVTSSHENCSSKASENVTLYTGPCQPEGLMVSYYCANQSAVLSWMPSSNAVDYFGCAQTTDGNMLYCGSTEPTCTIEGLECGINYTFSVQASDGTCNSSFSDPVLAGTVPCVPTGVSVVVDCPNNTAVVSWSASQGAVEYSVTAQSSQGNITCQGSELSCSLTNLTCGISYTVQVVAVGDSCSSTPSQAQTFNSPPCPPQDVRAEINCQSKALTVSWLPNADVDFFLVSRMEEIGDYASWNTSNTPFLMNMDCGKTFSVQVTAIKDGCHSQPSDPVRTSIMPCVPTGVSVVVDCPNNTAVVSWSTSQGAVQYSVTALSSQDSIICQGSELSCSLTNLTCGISYTVQVVAEGDSCSSTPSQVQRFNSPPCPPQDVRAEIDCLSEALAVSWLPNADVDFFLVSRMVEIGDYASWNTSNTPFSMNMDCGKTFSVQVTAIKDGCHSQPSDPVSTSSAPCQPQAVRGSLDCVTNSAWISWDAAAGAENYTVTAVGGEDYEANCTTSTNTTCEVQDLACGVLYNFSVTASNSQCVGPPSTTIDLQTAPCSLSSITAFAQCHNSSILVTWDLMEGGEGDIVYIATAEASDHTYLSCNSTGTSCYLEGARCDLHYTIIVAASSDQCSSLRSPPYRISMEPCPPSNVMVNVSCEDHEAIVSWTPSPVAETYDVVAMGRDGHVHNCTTSSSNCSLSDLHCGEHYTVFVTASHENCSSKASENVTLYTGPCQPEGLMVSYYCANQSAVLSWMPSSNAVDYFGCAQTTDGNMLYCGSTEPTCTIEGLECGINYTFSVQASDGTCNSSFSDPVLAGTDPCPPDSVQVSLLPMQMEIQVLRFTWMEINCTDAQYLLRMTGSILGDSQALFELSSFWTSMPFFEIPLPCSSSYVATVESRNAINTSEPSTAISGTTAPCPPSGVTYSGTSSIATVSWNAPVFATTYTVYNNQVSPRTPVCTTAALSCTVSNVASSSLVITASNAAGESEAVRVTNVVTQGRKRRDLSEEPTQENGDLSVPEVRVTINTTTAVVEWSPVEDASHYSLVFKELANSHTRQVLTVYGESSTLNELNPDSEYCVSVCAMNSATMGPWSKPQCVRNQDKECKCETL